MDNTKLKTKPRFKHDCKLCVYLGEYEKYDLYYCEPGNNVISRFGNNGEDYNSGLVFATPDGFDPLYEAKKRAIDKGYLI